MSDNLAPYAVHINASRGRIHEEPAPINRTEFQRDRDRIIHCAAFRRLEYKTQVFMNHEGDLFRTRLTHSLEVAQIARSIARNLRLNEDLVEAVSLAHDLGHTPFGHAGQDALNKCMQDAGGFEHNLQSLRVVDLLEERYGSFNGLNLTFETREGILKRCTPEHAINLGEIGKRFLLNMQPSLEAQVVNLADEIAYCNHDIDDGLRSGLLNTEQLESLSLYARYKSIVLSEIPDINPHRIVYETVRRMINAQIEDLLKTSLKNINDANLKNIDDVRKSPPIILFSPSMRTELTELRSFLVENLYRHYHVNRMMNKARHVIEELFDTFVRDKNLLPPEYRIENNDEQQKRRIADYIAGMTDRFAMSEYKHLFDISVTWNTENIIF